VGRGSDLAVAARRCLRLVQGGPQSQRCSGVYPTAPICGRFLSQTRSGPRFSRAEARLQCWARIGLLLPCRGHYRTDADLFTRSEIPVPVPSDAEWNTQPAEFDVLQHHVRRSTSSCTTWPIDDMTDELDDATTKAGDDNWRKGEPAGTSLQGATAHPNRRYATAGRD
jgi:hypothetical protein